MDLQAWVVWWSQLTSGTLNFWNFWIEVKVFIGIDAYLRMTMRLIFLETHLALIPSSRQVRIWFCPVSPHLIEINDIRLKWRWSFLDSSIATLNVLSKSSISKGLFYLSFMGIMCNYIPYCYGWVWTSKPGASFYAIFIL